MRAAFYAPLKPPGHPVPSGDRRIARLFQKAFARIEFETPLASRFRSREALGDKMRQARMAGLGPWLARRAIRELGSKGADLWFTYHLYYKANDWFGPEAAALLGVPYIIAEASFAPKRAEGPWELSHRRVAYCVNAATAILCLNPNDVACLEPITNDPGKLILFPPFVDTEPYRGSSERRDAARMRLSKVLGIPSTAVWLIAVGMMREGEKTASYLNLAQALAQFRPDRDWRLLVVGDGPARDLIYSTLQTSTMGRVTFAGERGEADLAEFYAAADIMVWPAHGEAFGMAMLEAQASGLPVVAGRTGGVPAVVEDGHSGTLVQLGDATAFAKAIEVLVQDEERRKAYAVAARKRVEEKQSMEAASLRLQAIMTGVGLQ